jgi:transcriptional regulator with XRE-family HTH domain
MTDERDVLGEILAYLTGETEPPAFDDLTAGERDEAEALLEEMKAAISVDFDAIPNYEDDPVAVRLGFRSGPEQARVYGPTIRKLRERAGLTGRELATAVSATGRTVDASWVNNLESGTWTTITAVEAEAIAGAVGGEERFLGDPSVSGSVIDQIATTIVEEYNQLTVSRFTEPFGDAFDRRLLVSFIDLRILLIVCRTDQEREAAVGFAVACVVDAERYAAIAAVADDLDLTTWLVRPGDVLEHYDTPAGTHTVPGAMPSVTPTTLPLALGKIIEGEVIRWPAFDLAWETVAGASDELRAAAKQAAFKKLERSAGRVGIDRRPAFQSVGKPDLERADRFISALLAGTSTETVDDYLAEVERAS